MAQILLEVQRFLAALGLFGDLCLLSIVVGLDGSQAAFWHCDGVDSRFDLGDLLHSRGHFGNDDAAGHQRLQSVFPNLTVDHLLFGLDLAAFAQTLLS